MIYNLEDEQENVNKCKFKSSELLTTLAMSKNHNKIKHGVTN